MRNLCLIILIFFSSNLKAQDGFIDKFLSKEYQDSVKSHPLGSISHNYTLTLSGWYDDCGEFGGHLETIEIKVIDYKLVADVIIYKKSCGDNKELRVKKSKQYIVNDAELIVDYLQELQVRTLAYNNIGHAGCRYRARMGFSDSNEDAEQLTRLNLSYVDDYCEWKKFEELKVHIQGK